MLSKNAGFWVPLLAALCAGFSLESPLDAIFSASLASVALIVAIADLDRFEIPDVASGLMFMLGLGWVLFSSEADYRAILDAVARSGVAASVLYGVRGAYYRVRGFEGLGLGDVKLAAAGAPWLPWTYLPLALLIAVSAAILLITFQVATRSNRIERNAAIPLGAFLAPAIWFAWFAANIST
jgi:leader peptidase (prepilin peptidase)/N-methyltransferase